MKTDTEILGKKLEEIRNLLLELECLKKDIQTLVDDKEEYFEMMIKKSRFFYRLYLNYIRLFIIDVHKLIDSKENYNIKSLINFCRTNIKRINWNREYHLMNLIFWKMNSKKSPNILNKLAY